MLSVRLPEPMERALTRHCTSHQRTKTQVVQEALNDYLSKTHDSQNMPLVVTPDLSFLPPDDPLRAFIGIAKGGMSTDALMRMTRGEDWNQP